jgi:2-amino-4-hydroxy-6-hydroxymethyldihydropteridine diphosphokinase
MTGMKTITFLLLGTNLGDRKKNLMTAREAIKTLVGQISKESSLYETAAWGKTNQPEFINQALEVLTALTPAEVLQKIFFIEQTMGRTRLEKWGERIIDIDILLYGNEIINAPALIVPHPEIANRKFALQPLAEIASETEHPLLKIKIRELLQKCRDPLSVSKVDEH